MEYLKVRGFSILWLAPVIVGLVVASLGLIIALRVPSFPYRVVGFISFACGGVLAGLGIWPTVAAARVFVSHSVGAEERVTLSRLKDLASAHRIRVEISRREPFGPHSRTGGLRHETKTAIARSDFVLAVITTAIDPRVDSELAYANTKGKLTVPIVGRNLEDSALLGRLPGAIRPFPGQSEEQIQAAITEFVQRHDVNKKLEKILTPVVGISLALLSQSR